MSPTFDTRGGRQQARPDVARPLDGRVRAQHGRELMGCKFPVGVPTWTHREPRITTSRRQGQDREGLSGGSRSARGAGRRTEGRLTPRPPRPPTPRPAKARTKPEQSPNAPSRSPRPGPPPRRRRRHRLRPSRSPAPQGPARDCKTRVHRAAVEAVIPPNCWDVCAKSQAQTSRSRTQPEWAGLADPGV